MSEFTSYYNRGFGMTFENGYSIAVQWGTVNDCSNFDGSDDGTRSMSTDSYSCENAEVTIVHNGAYDSTTKEVVKNVLGRDINDSYVGRLTTDEVARFITAVQAL